jgi:Ca-activated chloride channel family protein
VARSNAARPLAAAALGAAVWALAAGGGEPLALVIVSPQPGVPAAGEVLLAVGVGGGEAVREMRLSVDGRQVARLTAPPWESRVSLGEENREHRFEAVAVGASGATATDVLVTPALRVDEVVDLRLQQVYVAVEREGARVLDLGREDFQVFDDGVAQALVTFAGGEVPLAAALVIDASLSMRGEPLKAAYRGARTFIAGMRPLDEAMVAVVSDRLLSATPFLPAGELARSLREVPASGGTALNDHLYLALSLLDQRQGRRVAVLLSDGVDLDSALTMQEVLWRLRRSQTLLYWIRLGGPDPPGAKRYSAWRDPEGHAEELALLAEAVRLSGGRIVPAQGSAGLEAAFAEILSELRDQYVLGYYPSLEHRDGSWHAITVRVRREAVEVRSRAGYVDE